MECTGCGRYSPPDPETGYDADALCPDCQANEDNDDAAEGLLATITLSRPDGVVVFTQSIPALADFTWRPTLGFGPIVDGQRLLWGFTYTPIISDPAETAS